METAPRPPRARWIALASAMVIAIAVIAVIASIELSQTSPASPTHPYAPDVFPPLWTTTVPKDSAFGGVINNFAYYTIVPLSPVPNPNFFRFEVVAFSIQDGAILWNSTPISIWGAGNVAPQLVSGPTELYLVGYAANVTEPGAPWNGTGGVFAAGFDFNTGAPGFFSSQVDIAAIQVGEVEVSGDTIYAGYIANGSAMLLAFPLPSDRPTTIAWSHALKLPTGFSSNLVFSIEDNYELVLLPTSLAVLNATDGSYLENVPFSYPLNLFDGTVENGIAYGITYLGPSLFLQGFDLSTGSLAVNVSITSPGLTCEPFFMSHVGNVLFLTPDCGAVWLAYTLNGTFLWSSIGITTTPAPGSVPIPIGSREVLIYSYPSPPSSLPAGNYSFQGIVTVYNLTTGAVIWQENPWFEVASDLTLAYSPYLTSEPPVPVFEAWYSVYVVEWWGGSTCLAAV